MGSCVLAWLRRVRRSGVGRVRRLSAATLATGLAWLLLVGAMLGVAGVSLPLVAQQRLSVVLLLVLALAYPLGRLGRHPRARMFWRLVFIGVCALLMTRYMLWRATETLPTQFGPLALVCGLALFLAEGYGWVNTMFGFFINAHPLIREPMRLPDDPALLPHVDIYIPTYNEDPTIVRPTVIAATQIRYPAGKLHVHVLDDGGTAQKCNDPHPEKAAAARERAAELQAIAARYGAGYITRERNLHAKAGNLNNALRSTQGELLLVLDCDHIPTADFLERTVGFFLADPQLFVLQTPHNFVSPDPVERNLDTYETSPAENELFYDVMQPGLDFWGCSFFCGSAAILRRSVVDRLGGISGKSITEDAETTLDAMSLGYTSAYYGRPMVSGLQPETFSGFIVQRVRWGQGMWQIFLLKNPWRLPRLSFLQRLLYTNFAVYWGFAFARVVMLLAPPAYLLLGINLCDTSASQLLAYVGPSLVASHLSTQFFYGRVRWPFMSQLYEVVQSVFVVQGLIQVLRNPEAPSFKVTPKGEVLGRDFISSLAWPFYGLLGLNLAALWSAAQRYPVEPWNQGAILFVGFWAVLDAMLLLGALGIMLERRQVRSEPRAQHQESVLLDTESACWLGLSHDASSSGMRLLLPVQPGHEPPAVGTTVHLSFIERHRGDGLLAEVMSVRRRTQDGQLVLGLRYCLETVAHERLVVGVAFGSSEVLVANNHRRHTGRSMMSAGLLLLRFALDEGLDHFKLLMANLRGRWHRRLGRD